MSETDDLLPISALQHYVFCRRQAALIHIERAWEENRLTAEGALLHRRVESEETGWRSGTVEWRGVELVSRRLGLIGKADVVEVRGAGTDLERIVPVEYKRGKAKPHDADRIQVAAQALCLEEMLGCRIKEADLFYGQPRRREPVVLDMPLRQAVGTAAAECRAMVAAGRLPPPEPGRKCRSCSLADLCQPRDLGRAGAAAWLEAQRVRALSLEGLDGAPRPSNEPSPGKPSQ